MEEFTISNIEKWLSEFVKTMPLTCSNAEKLNIMCMAMQNMSHIHHEFTEEDAKEWLRRMNPPARWTMDQTTAVMKQHNFDHEPYVFCVVMNMLASDYGKTMAKYNADKTEIWADLAHDFIVDADAGHEKVGRYYRDIVK